MTVKRFKQMAKLICQELNIHEYTLIICDTNKGELKISFWTSLGFLNENDFSDELYLSLGGEKINKPRALKEIIKQLQNIAG